MSKENVNSKIAFMNTSRTLSLLLVLVMLLYHSCVSETGSLSETSQEDDAPEAALDSFAPELSAYDRIAAALFMGNVEEAIEAYEEAKLSQQDNSREQILLSRLYIIAGEMSEAQEILNSIPPEDENYTDVLLSLALVERSRNNKTDERDHLSGVIAREPENSQANALLGELFLEDGYYNSAEQHFSTALKQEPDNFIALQGLGNVYLRTRKEKEAIQVFSDAIEAEPDYSYTYMDRAKALSAEGNFTAAIEDANKAIELYEDSGWHYFDRGRIHAGNGSFEQARDDFAKAITLLPDIFLFHTSRAQMNGFLADYGAALDDYTNALAMRPDYYPAYPYAGALEYIRGNYSQAHEYFHKASESEESNTSQILFAGLALLAESEPQGKKYINNNLHRFDREDLLYKVARFYTDGTDTLALYGLQDENSKYVMALAQFYLALRYFQLGMNKTNIALLTSPEQDRLDGSPESLVRNWLIDESVQ